MTKMELQKRLKFVGKAYRFKNCYSCPSSEADYWWSYSKVLKVGEDGRLCAVGFEVDCNGEVCVRSNIEYGWTRFLDMEKITDEELRRAWQKLVDRVNEIGGLLGVGK